MKRLASPVFVVAACGLIVLTNVAMLAAAGWNRRGEPSATLALTERELAMPPARMDEGTGVVLSLVLAHEPPRALRRTAQLRRYELPDVDYDWLDRTKLRELGFRRALVPPYPDAERHDSNARPRRVYVVVECDGEAWTAWLTDREKQVRRLRERVDEGKADPAELADAEAVLEIDRTMRSRLFPVDAGLDPDVLRRRYPDRSRHAVMAGLIRPKLLESGDGAPSLGGEVLHPVVRRIHVPKALRPPLEAFVPDETWGEIEAREREHARQGWPSPAPPRYRADLAVGQRHEPWLVGVQPP